MLKSTAAACLLIKMSAVMPSGDDGQDGLFP
jgi:hypothetical protein